MHVRLETVAKLSVAKSSQSVSTTSCVGCESTSRANAVFSDLSNVRILGNCYLHHGFLFSNQ